eukprot:764922-Hanusia_phi.AAC.2
MQTWPPNPRDALNRDTTDLIPSDSASISSRDGSQCSQSSFGRGINTGSVKRAKVNNALTRDRKGASDSVLTDLLAAFNRSEEQTAKSLKIAKIKGESDAKVAEMQMQNSMLQTERDRDKLKLDLKQKQHDILNNIKKGISLENLFPTLNPTPGSMEGLILDFRLG